MALFRDSLLDVSLSDTYRVSYQVKVLILRFTPEQLKEKTS